MNDSDDFLLAKILSYVGRNHYRFVAAISTRFHTAYDVAFPGDTFTHINVSTVTHAINCVKEVTDMNWIPSTGNNQSRADAHQIFCILAAKQGNLPVLQYLRSVRTCYFPNGCPWDTFTSTMAAAYGHVHIYCNTFMRMAVHGKKEKCVKLQ